MQLTAERQITIPQHICDRMGLAPRSEVAFMEENGRFYLTKLPPVTVRPTGKFRRLRGIATVKMRTDEIMQLTRGER